MRLNKKGEGGFVEAIAAVMVVTVALTLFMALLPSVMNDDANEREIPRDVLNGLYVSEGKLCCDSDLKETVSAMGYSAMTLKVWKFGTTDEYTMTSGIPNGDDIVHRSGTMPMRVDGRTVNVGYEMAVWI